MELESGLSRETARKNEVDFFDNEPMVRARRLNSLAIGNSSTCTVAWDDPIRLDLQEVRALEHAFSCLIAFVA